MAEIINELPAEIPLDSPSFDDSYMNTVPRAAVALLH